MACLRMPFGSFVVILAFLFPLRVLTGDTGYSLLEPNRAYIVAALGYSVDLDCQLTDPEADVLLIQEVKGSADGIERAPDGVKVTQSGQIFTINNVEKSDEGTYHCKVQSTVLKIEKLYPAAIGSTQESYISSHSVLPRNNSVSEGESATFSCNVTGKGIKKVEWFKDKMALRSTFFPSGNSYISDLTLTAVTVSEAGAFECRTTVVPDHNRGYRGYKGKTGMLFVEEFHFLAKKRPYQRLFVGDSVTINCKTNDQKASASSLWVKKDSNPAQEIVPNGISITRRGNRFYFSNIALDNAGLYTCEATLAIINKTIEKEITSLLVFTGDNRNPQAQVYPLVKEALRGQDYNFSCQVPGDGISIKWLKDGVDVSSYQRHRQPNKMIRGFNFHEDILMLKDVSKEDVGNYTCVVTTSQNQGYSSKVTARLLSVKECLDPDNDEKFADPTDVYSYYECIQGVPVKKRCPVTYKWNQVEKVCKHPLSWLVDHDRVIYHLIPGVAFLLDCRLNNPNVSVEIYRKKLDEAFQRVYPRTDRFVKQNGQTFTITGLATNSKFTFECRTTTREAGTPVLKKTVAIERAKDFMQNVFVETIPSCFRGPLDETDSINIICHVLHFGEVKWFKSDQEITDSRVEKGVPIRDIKTGHWGMNSTLMLRNVTRSDAGSYVCSKSNGRNKTANVTVFIDVAEPSPARLSGQIQSPQAVNEGSNARFLCTVSGSPRPTVTWLKGTETVAVCEGKQHGICRIMATDRSKYKSNWLDERTCMVQHSSGQTSGRWSSSLIVLRTRSPADAASYSCVVQNGLGKPDKQVAVLEINVDPELVKRRDSRWETPNVVKDEKEELNCTTKRGFPPANFSWRYQALDCTDSSTCSPFKNKKWKPISSEIGRVDQRSPKTSILIVPPNIDKMYFKCTAVNPVTRAKDFIVYKFLRRGRVDPYDDLVVKPAPQLTRNEGQNITLSCEASLGVFKGAPVWTKDKKTLKIEQGRMNVKNWTDQKSISELHIQNAMSEDAGLYECNAVKDIDGRNYQKATRLTIKKLTKPTVLITPNVTTKKGQRTELFCNVTANPQPKKVIWTRNGEIVTPKRTTVNDCEQLVSDFYEVEDGADSSGGVWRLLVCSPSDAQQTGSYKCVATNIKGNGSATTYLNILEKPNPSVDPLLQNDSTLMLTCKASGNPGPVVHWEKDNGDGQFVPLEGRGEKRQLGQNVIEVQLSEETYGTTYRCVANNSQGYVIVDHLIQGPNVGQYKGDPADNKPFSKAAMIVVIACSSFVILLLLLIIFILYRRKKRYGGFFIFTLPPSPDYIMKLDPESSLLEQVNKLPYDAQWEFPRERLSVVRPLGSGAFGQVFLAQATGIVAFDPRGSTKRKSGRRRSRFGSTSRPYYNDKRVTAVAVKSLKENASEAEYRDLVSELKILIHIGEHKNIVNLLGACTKGRERDVWVIIEYCPHGNLLDFLRKRREIFEAKWTTPTEHADETFTTIDLYICALQVARAMEFLASRRCVHRDLAARNVLVGEDYVLKVADFGLARDIYKDEHYVKTTSGLLPVKWMAIEALVDRVYTHKSDVWSFGVLLWELFTLGGSPYPGLPANEVYQYLMEGNRMEQPVDCPDDMYEIMCQSWMHSPEDRPSFTDVVARLDKLLDDKTTETGEGYLDLAHGEDDPNLDEPIFDDEYLDPGESLLPPPGSPTSEDERHAPLPPLPHPMEEIELETFAKNPEEEEKQKFILHDPPKEKRVHRMDSELEKARKDTLEREKARESVDHDDFISEKEQLRSDDEDRDICERNSGIFEYPPAYDHKPGQNLLLVPLKENGYCGENYPPQGDVDFKTGKTGSLGRQPSNRYVKS